MVDFISVHQYIFLIEGGIVRHPKITLPQCYSSGVHGTESDSLISLIV